MWELPNLSARDFLVLKSCLIFHTVGDNPSIPRHQNMILGQKWS